MKTDTEMTNLVKDYYINMFASIDSMSKEKQYEREYMLNDIKKELESSVNVAEMHSGLQHKIEKAYPQFTPKEIFYAIQEVEGDNNDYTTDAFFEYMDKGYDPKDVSKRQKYVTKRSREMYKAFMLRKRQEYELITIQGH